MATRVKLLHTAISPTLAGASFTGDVNFEGSQLQYDASSNSLKFQDNIYAQFGTGDDLRIYHNGTDSYIDHATGSGDLFIRGQGDDLILRADDDIFIQPNGNDNGISVIGGSGVNIFHNGNQKFQTTSSGATVTGTLTVTGDLDITGNVNSASVTDLDVTDKTITLGVGQTEAQSGGSGIVIAGSNASMLWDETNGEFDFNNPLSIVNSIGGDTVLNLTGSYGSGNPVALLGFARSGGAVSGDLRYVDATTDMEIGTGTAHGFSLKTSGTRRLSIPGGGNIEITGGQELKLYRPTGGTSYLGILMDSGEKVRFRNSWGNKDLYFTRDGQFGVGVTPYSGTKVHFIADDTSPDFTSTAIDDCTLVLSNSDDDYGTVFATKGTGSGYIQQRRVASNVNYPLILQPNGSTVGIGHDFTPAGTLHIVGPASGQPRLYISDRDEGVGATDSLLITKSGINSYIYDRDASSILNLGHADDPDTLKIASNVVSVTQGVFEVDSGGTSGTSQIRLTNDNERCRITGNYDTGGGGRLGFWTDTSGGTLVQRLTIDNDGQLRAINDSGVSYNWRAGPSTNTEATSAQEFYIAREHRGFRTNVTANTDWRAMAGTHFYAKKSGQVRMEANMYIQSGAYYFKWRVKDQQGNVVFDSYNDRGTVGNPSGGQYYAYEYPSGQSGNVHNPKQYSFNVANIIAGRTYHIEMAPASAAGDTVYTNQQQTFLRESSVYSSAPADGSYSYQVKKGYYGHSTGGTNYEEEFGGFQHYPDTGDPKVWLGTFTLRNGYRYLDLALNLNTNSYMFYAYAEGYLYNQKIVNTSCCGYMYTNNSILASATVNNGTGNNGFMTPYRSTGQNGADSGQLCLKLDRTTTGYSEGNIHVFFGGHAPQSSVRVTNYSQNNSSGNHY